MKHDAFIGRWIIFHNGHLEIIRKVFEKNKRPVLILIMDSEETPTAYTRKCIIEGVLRSEEIPHITMIIPPIASVNWGRNVGYETNYIEVDSEIQKISATSIRERMTANDESWKNDMPL